MDRKTLVFLAKGAAFLLFWGWNLLLLNVLLLGFGPVVLFEMVVAVVMGVVPVSFALFGLSLVGMPVVAVLVGALTRLRTDPGRLLSFFYGVQVPVMVVVTVRVFAIHELVAANALLLAVLSAGVVALLRTLFVGGDDRPGLLVARLVASTGLVVVGTAWATLTALYAVPLVLIGLWETLKLPGEMIEGFLWALRHGDPLPLFVVPLVLFLLASLAMLAVMPFAAFGVSARNWQLVHRAAVRRIGPLAWGVSAVALVGLVGTFSALSHQPQVGVFERLEAVGSDTERRTLLADADGLRDALLGARLGPDRYLDADPDAETVFQLWDDIVGERLAVGPQRLAAALLAPVTYQAQREGEVWRAGRTTRDVVDAERAYADVFDAPMERAEREALLASALTTWSWQDVEAGLLDVGQRKVRLAEQAVEVEVHGDLATVRIRDAWRNQTFDRQEILLAFNLPETAAMTGVWLGHTAERDEAFAYIVAPRGAAQEVYEREVQRRVDPALLEQVGPQQYRLRAFPVEPRSDPGSLWSFGSEGPDLFVFLELVVPVVDGKVPLPALAQVRNAYWDDDAVRTLNGETVVVDDWLPADGGRGGDRVTHEAVVNGLKVRAEPAEAGNGGRRSIDVVIDGSFSMAAHEEALRDGLATLRAAHDVSVFCVVEDALGPCADVERPLFWGRRSAAEHLALWTGLQRTPDAVVVLTDAGSYDLVGDVEHSLPDVELPELWLVHQGGLPEAYPDWTLDRITRSGGGIGRSANEVVARMADPTVVDGWRWTVEPTEAPDTTGPFAAMAARRAIRTLAGQGEGALAQLDVLHGLAVDHHVVTPWSSMIVLVNDRQKEALEEASNADDRFDREAPTRDDDMVVSAVPEPSTWLLLLLGGGLAFRQRGSRRPAPTAG